MTAADDDATTQKQNQEKEKPQGPLRSGVDTGISSETIRAVVPTVAGVIVAFGVLLVFRVNTYQTVLRGSDVVSGLNDPYYFRYWMEQLLAAADGPVDLSVLSETSGQAFDGVRPATHAFNWWLAELTGPDIVTAWLPVFSSLAVGVMLFTISYRLTRDLRAGLATVGMLAFIPLHAVYSGIGFLDHQVHQYFWLGLLLTGLVWLAAPLQHVQTDDTTLLSAYLTTPTTWGVAMLTGVGIGLSVHAWGGSPLVIAPIFIYIVLRTPMDIRAGLSPGRAMLPVLGATAVGALLAVSLHVLLSWGELFVVLMPIYVFFGATVILGIGELWQRLSLPAAALLFAEGVVAGVGTWAATQLSADAISRYTERSDDLLGREGIAEVVSLFEPSVFTGPLLRLGVVFFIAVPVLLWLTVVVVRLYEPGWLSIVVYGWMLVILAAIQNRFAGQLSLVIAILAGVGFIALLGRLGVLRPIAVFPGPTAVLPNQAVSDASTTEAANRDADSDLAITRLRSPKTRRQYLGLGGSLATIGIVSAVLVDEQTKQTSYSDAEYQAARAIATHQEAVNREYPANFVLSRWGSNRMYNYFANGESESYGFARRVYPEFLTEESPDQWAQENLDRVGYVVIADDDVDLPPGTAYHMLQERLGVAMEYRDPLSHYRLLYVAGSSENPDDWDLSVFAIVPGATITGTGTPGETVTAGTELTISGLSFPYQQAATVDDNGEFEMTVPYPGDYSVGGTQVQITEAAVIAGQSFST